NRGVARKVLIKFLLDMGFNPNMTKTQTSRWFSVDGDKYAYLAIEKVKRDAERAKIEALAAEIRAKAEAEKAAEQPVEQAPEVEAPSEQASEPASEQASEPASEEAQVEAVIAE